MDIVSLITLQERSRRNARIASRQLERRRLDAIEARKALTLAQAAVPPDLRERERRAGA